MNELKNAQVIPFYAGSAVQGATTSDDKSPAAIGSLFGIFYEPVRIFESFRQRPRFLLAGILIALAVTVSNALIFQRLGFENILRAQLERSATHLTPEQREGVVEMQARPIIRTMGVASPIISLFVSFAAGGALYLLGVMAIGATVGYRQALAVWVFSAFPAEILTVVGNIAILFLKSPNDFDLARSANGLLHANLGVFMDAAAHPVLTTAVSSIDLLSIYALVLAILGLHKVARISPAKAAAVAGSFWVIGCLLKIGVSAVSNAALS
jgi:hypothetical protein